MIQEIVNGFSWTVVNEFVNWNKFVIVFVCSNYSRKRFTRLVKTLFLYRMCVLRLAGNILSCINVGDGGEMKQVV